MFIVYSKTIKVMRFANTCLILPANVQAKNCKTPHEGEGDIKIRRSLRY